MKVQELIDKLELMEPDAEILLAVEEHFGEDDVYKVEDCSVAFDENVYIISGTPSGFIPREVFEHH